jgi:hypothetical protein
MLVMGLRSMLLVSLALVAGAPMGAHAGDNMMDKWCGSIACRP